MKEEAMEQQMTATPVAVQHDFVALSPGEMTSAHDGMLRWAESKVAQMNVEIHEFGMEIELAEKNGWRTVSFVRSLRRAEQRKIFYGKIADALRAGYIVVPNFAMRAFAIRTLAEVPRGGSEIYSWAPPPFEQRAALLPAGVGGYINPLPAVATSTAQGPHDKEGKPTTIKLAEPEAFVDVEFPLAVAKPQIMGATAQAMALQIFDEIGMTEEWNRGTRGDPIVLGRLLNPRRNAPAVTFFIGWYFDARRV